MARYSPEHKAKTRERIVRSAGRLFRAKGFAACGVDAVMQSAGLTHGGFYAHFGSKRELFAEAVRDAVMQSGVKLDEMLGDAPPLEWLIGFTQCYLSAEHLARMRDGCALPSLLSEIDRAPKSVKVAFAESGKERTASVVRRFSEIGAPDPEGESVAFFSALAGALAMARAMPDAEAAEAVMAATRGRWVARIEELADRD